MGSLESRVSFKAFAFRHVGTGIAQGRFATVQAHEGHVVAHRTLVRPLTHWRCLRAAFVGDQLRLLTFQALDQVTFFPSGCSTDSCDDLGVGKSDVRLVEVECASDARPPALAADRKLLAPRGLLAGQQPIRRRLSPSWQGMVRTPVNRWDLRVGPPWLQATGDSVKAWRKSR